MKWLFVLVIFAGFLNWYSDQNKRTEAAEISLSHDNEVVLYATDWCGYCKKTREFLSEKGIEYYEYDIEKSSAGKRQYDELKGRGVPLLVVNSQVIRGYNPQAIVRALSYE